MPRLDERAQKVFDELVFAGFNFHQHGHAGGGADFLNLDMDGVAVQLHTVRCTSILVGIALRRALACRILETCTKSVPSLIIS